MQKKYKKNLSIRFWNGCYSRVRSLNSEHTVCGISCLKSAGVMVKTGFNVTVTSWHIF